MRLTDNGLEGLVDLRPEDEKFSFDKWTMSLTSTTRRFELLQSVDIDFAGAPAEQDYLAQFTLVDGCGLKPLKKPTEAQSEAVTETSQAETAQEGGGANAAPDNTMN